MNAARRPRHRRWRRPGVALLLALALLVPVTALAVLTGGSAAKSRTQEQVSARVERDATDLGALMAARSRVVNEYVPSSALVAADQFKITPAQIKQLFGIDYPAVLHAAREPVDADAALRSDATLIADLKRLHQLRPEIDNNRGNPDTVRDFFEKFEVDIDNVFRARFQFMERDIEGLTGKTGLVAQRVDALSNSFAVLMAATSRAQQSDLVVTGPWHTRQCEGSYRSERGIRRGHLGVSRRARPPRHRRVELLAHRPAVASLGKDHHPDGQCGTSGTQIAAGDRPARLRQAPSPTNRAG